MWLISDYDGTLRNGKDGQVDPKDLAFVKNFIEKGNKFVIATGRPQFMIEKNMDDLGLKPDYYITNAGTFLLDQTKKVVFSTNLALPILKELLDYLKTIELESVIYADKMGEYYLFTNVDNPEKLAEKRPILNHDYDDLYGKEIACFKIIDTPQVLEKLTIDLEKHFSDRITLVVNTDSNLLEIHPKSSSKGHAVKHLQKILNIPDDQIIVAGDDDNDVTMLDAYQNSFCIRQPYNQRIQTHGTYLIDALWEIETKLK